jgi:flavodoxin
VAFLFLLVAFLSQQFSIQCVVFMKTLIVCYSHHHGNTQKVAEVIAKELDAEVKTPEQVTPSELADFDLVGFGSGIYMSKPHKSMLELADNLISVNSKKAFIFSTSGQPYNGDKFHSKLREKVKGKGYTVLGEFNCTGFDTFGPFKLVGGLRKGHPNEEDLKEALGFAEKLKLKL